MCNLQPTPGQDRSSAADLDSQLQEQERIINISYALASEASQRSKQVAGEAMDASLQVWLPLTAWARSPARPVRESAENQLSGLVVAGGVCSPVPQTPQGVGGGTGQGRWWEN